MNDIMKQAEESFKEIQASGATNAELALNMLTLVDSINEQTLAKFPTPISCKKGCSHCCYQLVGTTSYEVDLISEVVGFDEKDKERIQRLAKYKTVEEWGKLSHADKRCLFLSEDNECRIYAVRPFACRSYFVVSKPELCDTTKKKEVQILENPNVNAVYHAFVGLFGKSGKLNELLAEALRRKNEL